MVVERVLVGRRLNDERGLLVGDGWRPLEQLQHEVVGHRVTGLSLVQLSAVLLGGRGRVHDSLGL